MEKFGNPHLSLVLNNLFLNGKTLRKVLRLFCTFCLILCCLLWPSEVEAGVLAERVAKFPQWNSKPPVQAVKGTEDLVYPDWMAGTWQVTSTMVDMVAPLAPDIVTPGFENNRRYLNQPIYFLVRFVPIQQNNFSLPIFTVKSNISTMKVGSIVADRAFNGLNIAKETLGDRAVLSVKTDPSNPNRQITLLPRDLQLVSIVTSRNSEILDNERFVATEITQQFFRGTQQVYLNEVETTTEYHLEKTANARITANQITAIYLSSKDPNYFNAAEKPVALYRYHLELFPISN